MKSEKRIFNVASYKRNAELVKMLESIANQADVINVVVNVDESDDFIEVSQFCRHVTNRFSPMTSIRVTIMDNSKLGDSAKFLMLPVSDGYFFTVDDDLIYPPTYADDMIKAYQKYEQGSIVALHGRNFMSWPIDSYYNSPFVKYRALGSVASDVKVEFAGTCTTMWHTDLLKFSTKDITSINMGDIWLSYFAAEKGIPIMVLAHNFDYLGYLLKPEDKTIFVDYQKDHKKQTDLANKIYG